MLTTWSLFLSISRRIRQACSHMEGIPSFWWGKGKRAVSAARLSSRHPSKVFIKWSRCVENKKSRHASASHIANGKPHAVQLAMINE